MSGVAHGQDTDWDAIDDDEDETDPVTEWFLESGPTDSLVIHHHNCNTTEDDRRICSCIPVTLVRGATA